MAARPRKVPRLDNAMSVDDDAMICRIFGIDVNGAQYAPYLRAIGSPDLRSPISSDAYLEAVHIDNDPCIGRILFGTGRCAGRTIRRCSLLPARLARQRTVLPGDSLKEQVCQPMH